MGVVTYHNCNLAWPSCYGNFIQIPLSFQRELKLCSLSITFAQLFQVYPLLPLLFLFLFLFLFPIFFYLKWSDEIKFRSIGSRPSGGRQFDFSSNLDSNILLSPPVSESLIFGTALQNLTQSTSFNYSKNTQVREKHTHLESDCEL